jgi:uncharacterized glyoxalase superfamily protein PhnB
MESNVKQVVPFFMVEDIQRSLAFYVDGLGFEMTNQWINSGLLEWCWLQIGGAAIMLQQYRLDRKPAETQGQGICICFQCADALAFYHNAVAKGIAVKEPFVGNNMWVTNMADPDGYQLSFESPTDVPEETKLSEWKP